MVGQPSKRTWRMNVCTLKSGDLNPSLRQSNSLFSRISQICEKRLLALSRVCPSISMQQLGSHWKDFDNILYLNFSEYMLKNFQVSLKFDKNKVYFTWRCLHLYGSTSLNYSQYEKHFKNFVGKTKTHTSRAATFFPKTVPFMWQGQKMWCGQRRSWRGGCTLRAGKVSLHAIKHTHTPAPPPPRSGLHSSFSRTEDQWALVHKITPELQKNTDNFLKNLATISG
jgi:hypothetical protein